MKRGKMRLMILNEGCDDDRGIVCVVVHLSCNTRDIEGVPFLWFELLFLCRSFDEWWVL